MAVVKHPVEQHEEMLGGLKKVADDHEERLRKLEEDSVRSSEQLKNLYETVGAIKQMIIDQRDEVGRQVSEIKQMIEARLSPLEKRDTDNLRVIRTAIITAIVSGFATFVVTKLLGG